METASDFSIIQVKYLVKFNAVIMKQRKSGLLDLPKTSNHLFLHEKIFTVFNK